MSIKFHRFPNQLSNCVNAWAIAAGHRNNCSIENNYFVTFSTFALMINDERQTDGSYLTPRLVLMDPRLLGDPWDGMMFMRRGRGSGVFVGLESKKEKIIGVVLWAELINWKKVTGTESTVKRSFLLSGSEGATAFGSLIQFLKA